MSFLLDALRPPRSLSHDPLVIERFEIARDHLQMARLASRSGSREAFIRREVRRALAEVRAAARVLRKIQSAPAARPRPRGRAAALRVQDLIDRLIADLGITSSTLSTSR